MNISIKMIATLTVTAVVVGSALAGFFQLVAPRIEANRLAEEKRAIFAVLKGVSDYEIIDREVDVAVGKGKNQGKDQDKETVRIFRGFDDEGRTKGYAFIAKGPGFAAAITMMVGLNVSRKTLSGLKVLDQIETPGLGNLIAMEPFESQFRGLEIEPKIEYIKNKKPEKPNQIQAITGATISSKAVVDAINKRLVVILDLLASEPITEPVSAPSAAGGGVDSAEGEVDALGVSAENPSYKVNARIESGILNIVVKDKETQREFGVERPAVVEDGINKIFFLGERVFVIDCNSSVNRELLFVSIKADESLEFGGLIAARYFIDSNKRHLIYLNRVTPREGSTHMKSADLGKLKSGIFNPIEEKIIFRTIDFKDIDEKLIISPRNVIWGGKEESIFFICYVLRGEKEKYLFHHDIQSGKSRMVKKLDKHSPGSEVKSLRWLEKEKVVEAAFSDPRGGKDYIYKVSGSN